MDCVIDMVVKDGHEQRRWAWAWGGGACAVAACQSAPAGAERAPRAAPLLLPLPRSLQVVKKKTGTFVHVMVGPEVGQIAAGFLKGALGLGPRYRVEYVTPNGAQLARLFELWQQGKLKPQLAATMPLARAAEAQDETKRGHNRGKIVLTIP